MWECVSFGCDGVGDVSKCQASNPKRDAAVCSVFLSPMLNRLALVETLLVLLAVSYNMDKVNFNEGGFTTKNNATLCERLI